jgi:hypothetical protein
LTLEELFVELDEQFSEKMSEMELHEKMKARTQKKGEPTQDYVFEMSALGKKQENIIQCVLRGLRDSDLRQVTMASCPRDVATLMTKIRFFEGIN